MAGVPQSFALATRGVWDDLLGCIERDRGRLIQFSVDCGIADGTEALDAIAGNCCDEAGSGIHAADTIVEDIRDGDIPGCV